MTERDKETIIRYLNLVMEELLNLRKKANDIDNQILNNHKNINRMVDYVAAEEYEIIWESCQAIKIVERKNNEY